MSFRVLDLNQSKADTFVGTPSYMSPELFLGKSYNHKVSTVKILNFGKPEIIAVIYLKFKQRGQTLMQME